VADGAIRTVTVVGGGIVGWSAAAALKRRIPALEVSILPLAPPADALSDRITATLPSIRGFHGDLGIGEGDAVVRTGSGYRLGTTFEGWSSGGSAYTHSYARHGQPFAGASFHLHWVRAAKLRRAGAFDAHSPAVALAREARFAPPSDEPNAPFSGYDYGLQLDLDRYRAMIGAFARHCGVAEIAGTLDGVRLADDGAIDALALDGGRVHRADLFVDATGPAARLRSALDDRREDWSRWLPCDRVLLATAPPLAEPPPLDRVTAMATGWRWSAPSPARTGHGIAYASAHLSDAKAARQLRATTGAQASTAAIRIDAGTRPEPWRRNCGAIGEAATVVEPLEWCNLHLAHSAIDRVIAMLPDRDFAAVELADYNRHHMAEAIRVRDFLALHYATASRDEPFWRDAAAVEPPATLAHTLALFRERGRLPFHEEETFSRDSWLAVLFGQGVIPRRVDALAEAIPVEQTAQALAAMRRGIDERLSTFPTHAAFLAAQLRQLVS
jgi:tryptophan halogenase